MNHFLPSQTLSLLQAGPLQRDLHESVRAALVAVGWEPALVGTIDLNNAIDCRLVAEVAGEAPPNGALCRAIAAASAVEEREIDLAAPVLSRTHAVVVRDLVAAAIVAAAPPVDQRREVVDEVEVAVARYGGLQLANASTGLLGRGGRIAGAVRARAETVNVVEPVMRRVAPDAEITRGASSRRARADEAVRALRPVDEAVRDLRPVDEAAPLPGFAAAVRGAAGPVDVAAGVMAALGLVGATASRREEAPVDADVALSASLDRELDAGQAARVIQRLSADRAARTRMTDFAAVGRRVRSAVERSAGAPPWLWHEVAAAIGIAAPEAVDGWERVPVADAVRRAAGTVDVRDAVMDKVTPAPSLRRVSEDDDAAILPTPANEVSWSIGFAVMAAAALLLVFVPRMFAPEVTTGFREVPATFAAAGEINVDEIRSGPKASVFVETPIGNETPLIIWVDDGGEP